MNLPIFTVYRWSPIGHRYTVIKLKQPIALAHGPWFITWISSMTPYVTLSNSSSDSFLVFYNTQLWPIDALYLRVEAECLFCQKLHEYRHIFEFFEGILYKQNFSPLLPLKLHIVQTEEECSSLQFMLDQLMTLFWLGLSARPAAYGLWLRFPMLLTAGLSNKKKLKSLITH